MIWHGKALGAVIGVFAAGPVGAVFGAFIGHLFDAQADSPAPKKEETSAQPAPGIQEAYFRGVFQVMGHLAKADGRVSEKYIHAARSMMTEFKLGERETRFAIELFALGKRPDFPLETNLRELRKLCGDRNDLCRMFVQIQLQAALWSESLSTARRGVLARVCAALGVSAYDVVQMEALLRMQQSMNRPRSDARPRVDRISAAYNVLGVSKSATDAEVTKAYRRLMNQNHPDKLHAKGLPESMMELAAQKTRQIRSAYEVLRDARGIRRRSVDG